MNKTLKTFGWICLILGVLGILAGSVLLVLGQQWTADRQATAEELRASLTEGKLPKASDYCLFIDEDGDGKPDSDCLQPPAAKDGFSRRGAILPQGRPMQMRGNRPGWNRPGFGGGGLMLFFAPGAVLAVIGAVILLVNRPPKTQKALPAEEKKAGKDEPKKTY